MEMSHTPQFGARFELLRDGQDDDSVRYVAKLHLPDAVHTYEVRIGTARGDCQIAARSVEPATSPAPDPWVLQHLHALARQLYRAAQSDGSWQRRLMRWRGAPASP